MWHREPITRREFMQRGSVAALALGVPVPAETLVGEAIGEELSPKALSRFDLTELKWQVSGFVPYLWSIDHYKDIRQAPDAEIGPIDAPVPGSVQKALLNAEIVKDWNVGLNAREMEWVENRDWVYQTEIPDEWIGRGSPLRLRCAGLDWLLYGRRGNLHKDFDHAALRELLHARDRWLLTYPTSPRCAIGIEALPSCRSDSGGELESRNAGGSIDPVT